MRFTVREVVGLMMVSTVLYLILTHAGGFSTSVGAIGKNLSTVEKTLQGR